MHTLVSRIAPLFLALALASAAGCGRGRDNPSSDAPTAETAKPGKHAHGDAPAHGAALRALSRLLKAAGDLEGAVDDVQQGDLAGTVAFGPG